MTPQEFKARINQILDDLDPKDDVVVVTDNPPVLLVMCSNGEAKGIDLTWTTI